MLRTINVEGGCSENGTTCKTNFICSVFSFNNSNSELTLGSALTPVLSIGIFYSLKVFFGTILFDSDNLSEIDIIL